MTTRGKGLALSLMLMSVGLSGRDDGTSLRESCARAKAAQEASLQAGVDAGGEMAATVAALGPAYARIVKDADAETRRVFEPAVEALEELERANGSAYGSDVFDRIYAVDAACGFDQRGSSG